VAKAALATCSVEETQYLLAADLARFPHSSDTAHDVVRPHLIARVLAIRSAGRARIK
jgi:hypothetical protein